MARVKYGLSVIFSTGATSTRERGIQAVVISEAASEFRQTCCFPGFQTRRRTERLAALQFTAADRFGNRRHSRFGNLCYDFGHIRGSAIAWLVMLALFRIFILPVSSSPPQPCSLDSSFNPALNTGAAVYFVTLQTNGQILIGGSFSSIDTVPIANVARLNPDGTLDQSFSPGAAADIGYVNAIAVQSDGKILIGGSFFSSAGITPENMARLNSDGTVDSDFDPNLYLDAPVNAIVVQPDGQILVGGSFGIVDSLPRRSIARLNSDGTLDAAFDACVAASAGSGATGLAILGNGKILASGNFTFSTGLTRYGIARLNSCGDLDTGYAVAQPGVNSGATVYTFALRPDGRVVLGGDFQAYRTTLSTGIVQLSIKGSVDTTFAPGSGIDNGTTVYATALQTDGKLLIGGNFNTYSGQMLPGVARITTNGSPDVACAPGLGPNNSVSSLAIQIDGKILVAGKFTAFDNNPRNGLARLNGDPPPPRLGLPVLLGNGQVQLMFYGQDGTQCSLQSSSNLVDWITITNFTVVNPPFLLVDPMPNPSPNFYRILGQ